MLLYLSKKVISYIKCYNIYHNLNQLYFPTFSSQSQNCFAVFPTFCIAASQITKCEPLRRYATFKLRKFQSLFYKIHTKNFWKKLPLALDCKQGKYSLLLYNIHIFSILGVHFPVHFLCYFKKLQVLVVKKFWNYFSSIVLVFVWAQKACPRFLKSYFKFEILFFFSFLTSF